MSETQCFDDSLEYEFKRAVSRKVQPLVRLLPITSCYQCFDRDTDKCICNKTGKMHPPPGSIPDWCPLKPNDLNHAEGALKDDN